jgi:hypothetical protein
MYRLILAQMTAASSVLCTPGHGSNEAAIRMASPATGQFVGSDDVGAAAA